MQSGFQNPCGSLLSLDGVIVFRGQAISRESFNSQSFLFRVAIAGEKLVHFGFKCHLDLQLLWSVLSTRSENSGMSLHIGRPSSHLSHIRQNEELLRRLSIAPSATSILRLLPVQGLLDWALFSSSPIGKASFRTTRLRRFRTRQRSGRGEVATTLSPFARKRRG